MREACQHPSDLLSTTSTGMKTVKILDVFFSAVQLINKAQFARIRLDGLYHGSDPMDQALPLGSQTPPPQHHRPIIKKKDSLSGSEIKGSRLDLLEQTMNQDWELRPNNLNPRGSGPGQEGFIKIAGILGTFMQNLKFQRRKWLICGGDKVKVCNEKNSEPLLIPPLFPSRG